MADEFGGGVSLEGSLAKDSQNSSTKWCIWLPARQRAVKACREDRQVKFDQNSKVPRARREGEAVVEIRRAGLCGSDIHSYLGKEKGLAEGTIRGHEFSGVIVELCEVKGFSVGDRVFAPFSTCCGRCDFCQSGLTARCTAAKLFGWKEEKPKGEEEGDRDEEEDEWYSRGLDGGQAEYVIVPNAESTLVRLSDDLSFEEGVLCGDILATGYFCCVNGGLGAIQCSQSSLERTQLWPSPFSSSVSIPFSTGCSELRNDVFKVMIIGCGPVGIMAIVCALFLFSKNENLKYEIYAADRVENRLKIASRLGATPINVDSSPLSSLSNSMDVVLEAVGASSALKMGLQMVRSGGTLSSIGVHTSDFPFTPNDLYDKNATLRFGRCSARAIGPLVGDVIRFSKEKIGFDIAKETISHIVPLSDAPKMYEEFAERKEGVVKVVFDPARGEEKEEKEKEWLARVTIPKEEMGPETQEILSSKWLRELWGTKIVSEEGRVEEKEFDEMKFHQMVCFGMGVKQIEPDLFSLLSRTLHTLHLDHNSLSTLPSEIGQLSFLRELAVHSNKLSSLPESIGGLCELRTLRVDDNCLTSLPLSLSSLRKLRVLHLGGNQIKKMKEVVSGMVWLQDLMIGENDISEEERTMIFESLSSTLVY